MRSVMRRIWSWLRELFSDQMPPDYELLDPSLSAYDHGLGELRVEGVLKGYLASVRLEMVFPARQWWVWFVVVWADGRRERPLEDYGPKWLIVRELDAGYFDHFGPTTMTPRPSRFFARFDVQGGEPQVYGFAWLPAGEAAAKWQELGLNDDDF